MSDEPNATIRHDHFANTVNHCRRGLLQAELSEQLHALVGACRDTGKRGTLTLKLTVIPDPAGDTVDIEDDVAVKAPKPTKGKSLFFADPHGNLTRTDPRQAEMFGESRSTPVNKAQ